MENKSQNWDFTKEPTTQNALLTLKPGKGKSYSIYLMDAGKHLFSIEDNGEIKLKGVVIGKSKKVNTLLLKALLINTK